MPGPAPSVCQHLATCQGRRCPQLRQLHGQPWRPGVLKHPEHTPTLPRPVTVISSLSSSLELCPLPATAGTPRPAGQTVAARSYGFPRACACGGKRGLLTDSASRRSQQTHCCHYSPSPFALSEGQGRGQLPAHLREVRVHTQASCPGGGDTRMGLPAPGFAPPSQHSGSGSTRKTPAARGRYRRPRQDPGAHQAPSPREAAPKRLLSGAVTSEPSHPGQSLENTHNRYTAAGHRGWARTHADASWISVPS